MNDSSLIPTTIPRELNQIFFEYLSLRELSALQSEHQEMIFNILNLRNHDMMNGLFISSSCDFMSFVTLFFGAMRLSHVVVNGLLYRPRPNIWTNRDSDGNDRPDHDPPLTCNSRGLCCWQEKDEGKFSRNKTTCWSTDDEIRKDYAIFERRHALRKEIARNPPAAFVPVIPTSPIEYHFHFRWDEYKHYHNEDVPECPSFLEQWKKCFLGDDVDDDDDEWLKQCFVYVNQNFTLVNPAGIYEKHRGSDHMNVHLPFENLVVLEQGIYSLYQIAERFIVLRSHKFENNYELICGVEKKTHGANVVYELRVDHGS